MRTDRSIRQNATTYPCGAILQSSLDIKALRIQNEADGKLLKVLVHQIEVLQTELSVTDHSMNSGKTAFHGFPGRAVIGIDNRLSRAV